ncbi:MAG: hypothetical protein GXP56_18975 [Deltaproteobacteria bacterium]|nr:hypothetical protein [Deltaproteobacteria bacterium]
MKETEISDAIINSYSVLVDYLADFLGSNCEIVLHVIEDGVSIIKKIRNNHISGRELGKKTDEIGIRISKRNRDIDYIVNNYETSPTGIEIKTNTFLIKTPDGKLIGMMCVNIDLSLPLLAKNCIEDFFGKLSTSSLAKKICKEKHVAPVIEEKDIFKSLSRDIINDVISEHGVPVERMTPEERIAVIGKLKERGVFRIKYAVREVARRLNVSEPSVYRYFKEL